MQAQLKKENNRLMVRLCHLFTRSSAHYALGTVLATGLIGGSILAYAGFNWALELTDTETFCITCHEMEQNAYREYTRTIHYMNRTGVRATCSDCHVPKTWTHKVARKIHASKEVFHHFAGTIDTPEKYEARRLQLAKNVWAAMKETDSRECRNCHNYDSMDLSIQQRHSRERHEQGIDEEKTCIDCHKGVAHELPAGTYEAEKQISLK